MSSSEADPGMPDPLGGRARDPLSELTVVIPAFNEEAAIGQTLRELRDAVPAAEILVVDDGSTDRTAEVARSIAGVRVLSHPRNQGYGASLKTAVRACRRRFVVWYDADGQHRPEDLLNVVKPVLEGERDVTIGVRGRGSARQGDRAVGKWLLYQVAQMVSRERIPDLNSGLRCFPRQLLALHLYLLPDGFSASSTSTLLMLKRGYRVGWIPIVARRRVGHSTVRILRDGLRTLHLIVRIVVLFEAFRVFSALGFALMVPGLIYGLAMALLHGQGFPTLAGTAVIAGLVTFFMGIVADQVVELRKERLEAPIPEDTSPRQGPDETPGD
ncbi:MAG: glycosyltransferase family 2 protein [Myxococcota bacterium]